MSFIQSPAKKLFLSLVDRTSGLIPYFLRSNRKKSGLEIGKPGEVIEKLSFEEREILKGLTSEEVQATPVAHDKYICDEYWEKKAEEQRYKEYLEGSKLKK